MLFPWHKEELPTPMELLDGVFHFHPAMYEYYASHPKQKGILEEQKLFFHICIQPHKNYDDPLGYECANEHHEDEKLCLNYIFGMRHLYEGDQLKYEDSRKFYEWLQSLMCPSVTIHTPENKFNPVAVFMLTHLTPGWVGGVLTAIDLS